jgi:hypothetical protein
MEQLFGLMPKVLKDLGADDGTGEAVAFAAWKQCAGDLICERTKPLEYFEERLIVAVQDETWRSHLEDLSPRMLAKLNATLGHGSVKFIEFRVDPTVFDARRLKDEKAIAEVPAPPTSIIEAANAIEDEKLRDRFLAAAGVYLAKES